MSSRIPVVRPISWVATIPQFAAGTFAITIGALFLGVEGAVLGSGSYLAYSFGSRILFLRSHRAGRALTARELFEEAIPEYEQSLQFFDRYSWIDRYRSIVLMSPSAICYREMAMLNIAFCYGQIGDGKQMRYYYEECLKRFPESGMAQTSLRMLDLAESAVGT